MKDPIRTLVIDANGVTWKAVLADTTLKGLLGLKDRTSPQGIYPEGGILHQLLGPRNEPLSYVLDWREAFCEAPELAVEVCSITNFVGFLKSLRRIGEYPLTVILHSATGDSVSLLRKVADRFQRRRGKLAVFIGNEYNLLMDKIGFMKAVEADYVCTQLPAETARWLYGECTRSEILCMPHALNPRLYSPDSSCRRSIDMGFVGDLYHNLIGDMERTNLILFFQKHGADFEITSDIRFRRLSRGGWVQFLRECRGILGAESGTYYLDKTGEIIESTRAYVKAKPEAAFEDVYERFFKGRASPVSGKAISSRHFEPIGTKTCQVLIEGCYNGILKGDEHYISVKKDLSNIDDVIHRFKDNDYRHSMVERTYEYVMASHTYRHRIQSFLDLVVRDL